MSHKQHGIYMVSKYLDYMQQTGQLVLLQSGLKQEVSYQQVTVEVIVMMQMDSVKVKQTGIQVSEHMIQTVMEQQMDMIQDTVVLVQILMALITYLTDHLMIHMENYLQIYIIQILDYGKMMVMIQTHVSLIQMFQVVWIQQLQTMMLWQQQMMVHVSMKVVVQDQELIKMHQLQVLQQALHKVLLQ